MSTYCSGTVFLHCAHANDPWVCRIGQRSCNRVCIWTVSPCCELTGAVSISPQTSTRRGKDYSGALLWEPQLQRVDQRLWVRLGWSRFCLQIQEHSLLHLIPELFYWHINKYWAVEVCKWWSSRLSEIQIEQCQNLIKYRILIERSLNAEELFLQLL